MNRFVQRLRERDDEAGIAMLTALVFILLVAMFSLMMLGLVMAEVKPTVLGAKSSRTITAAQAGIDAAAAKLRNSMSADASGSDMGDPRKLPCSVTGTVDANGGGTRYAATIGYFRSDPRGKDAIWRSNSVNRITCAVETGLSEVPQYAVVVSEGFDDSATAITSNVNRTVEATYEFQLTSVNVAGGYIFSRERAYCLVADSATVGAAVRYQSASACSDDSATNLWRWGADYMIHLASTDGTGEALCMTGRPSLTVNWSADGSVFPGPANDSVKGPVTLDECTTSTADPKGQRFSWRTGGTWQGQTSTNTYAWTTLQAATRTAGANLTGVALTVGLLDGSGSRWSAFEPDSRVGPGNASKATNQIVNQLEFGRCLDVFRDKVWMPYDILYPCKQDPSGSGGFLWNHKWYYDEPAAGNTSVQTTISVKPDNLTGSFGWMPADLLGHNICYVTPDSGQTGIPVWKKSPASGDTGAHDNRPEFANFSFPTFWNGDYIWTNNYAGMTAGSKTDCSSDRAIWTRYANTGDAKTSWTFQDKYGRCLSASGPLTHAVPYGGDQWTTIVVATCDGSLAQKWNAVINPSATTLSGFVELSSG